MHRRPMFFGTLRWKPQQEMAATFLATFLGLPRCSFIWVGCVKEASLKKKAGLLWHVSGCAWQASGTRKNMQTIITRNTEKQDKMKIFEKVDFQRKTFFEVALENFSDVIWRCSRYLKVTSNIVVRVCEKVTSIQHVHKKIFNKKTKFGPKKETFPAHYCSRMTKLFGVRRNLISSSKPSMLDYTCGEYAVNACWLNVENAQKMLIFWVKVFFVYS